MDSKQIQPVGSRLLIKPYTAATKSAAGLVMESTSNTASAPVRGTVIASGDESKFKKGQDILYRRYSVDILKIITDKGEEEVMMVEDEDILAIIKTNKK